MTLLFVLLALFIGLVSGLVLRDLLLFPGDRRRLQALAAQLQAEQRIDALTRQTLVAMRAAMQASLRPER